VHLPLIELPLPPLLQVLLLLAIIILASKAAGAISKKLGQPAVLGELLVGLILGPTALNLLHWAPFDESARILEQLTAILPADQVAEIAADPHKMETFAFLPKWIKYLAELGVIFLMMLAGLETDLKEMKKVGLAAFLGATGGVALPFIAGTVISRYIGGFDWFPSIFIGTILTATSVSISAQTLLEMDQFRSKSGTTILGAAVIDDVMGIILLSVVVALHAAEGGGAAEPVWWILIKMVSFFGLAIWLGGKFVPKLIRWAEKWPGIEAGFAITLVIALFFAFAAEGIGKVAAITGSYLIGVVIAQNHDLAHKVVEKLSTLAYSFFVPVFFVSIGLEANAVSALKANPTLAIWIVVASIVTKIVGSGLGVKVVGFSLKESIQVGTGMISRGEVALIVANIGLAAGVINQDIFSVMVIMTLVTTLVTPLLLKVVYRGAVPVPDDIN